MSALYTTEAISSGDGRNGIVRVLDGAFEQQLVVPKELGGPGGEQTNPEQLFASGYAACFHNGLRLLAAQRKLRLADSTVTATVSLIALDESRFGLEVGLSAYLPGLTQPEADELVQATHQVCPYSNATRGNVQIALAAAV
jgi:osmotically inducible protein OsmC